MKEVRAEELLALIGQILTARGVPEEDAEIVGEALIEANLRGHDSHGVVRIPRWTEGLEAGRINAACKAKIVTDTLATASVDGDRGLGPVVGRFAMSLALRKATEQGVGVVSVRRASHMGMLGYYTELAAKEEMVGISMTNTEPAMAPYGGVEKVLGTNPLSISVPSREKPLILDMSTSVVARGKIVLASHKNEAIPEGWAIGKNGKITTNPREALEGTLLPAGGVKGYCLAVMIDLLTGALAGASVGKKIRGTLDMKNEGTKGDFFAAIDPKIFTTYEGFLDNVESLKTDIKKSKRAYGVEEIYLPGEIEYRTRGRRLQEGIPLEESLHRELVTLARQP